MKPRSQQTLATSALLAAALACVPATENAAPVDAEAHAAEIEQWRQERFEGLQKPDGWFSLVGLSWLAEGENSVGSDPSSTVPLPESAPADVGVLTLIDGRVEFAASPGVEVTVGGEPKSQAVLATDQEGEPTAVELGSIRFHLIDRGGRIGVRVKDSESPALLAFHGLENYPVDPGWRTDARFVPYDPPKPIAVPSVLGTTDEVDCPGAVEFSTSDGDHRLDVLPGAGEYFIVFGDETNGPETYGGGRFLYADEADADGRVVLDFNKAYNPPCAFTPYATCPLPPRQNRLALAIRAGEKKYAGGIEH